MHWVLFPPRIALTMHYFRQKLSCIAVYFLFVSCCVGVSKEPPVQYIHVVCCQGTIYGIYCPGANIQNIGQYCYIVCVTFTLQGQKNGRVGTYQRLLGYFVCAFLLLTWWLEIVWVFFACTNFPGINDQGKKFSQSPVIVKIKCTKIKLRHQVHDMMELEEFRIDVCVCGQHIYKDIWYAVVGEVLVCEREPDNFQDRYAVAVKNENSARLIFVHKVTRENILTAKITQTMVVHSCMAYLAPVNDYCNCVNRIH